MRYPCLRQLLLGLKDGLNDPTISRCDAMHDDIGAKVEVTKDRLTTS